MIKIYVGCALTHAPENFVKEVALLKEDLRKLKDVSVIEFFGLGRAKKCEIFQKDVVEGVGQCDFLLAICDFPSLGLGFEISEALKLKKPTLAVAHHNAKVSDLILDLDCGHPECFSFRTYKNLRKDIAGFAKEAINKIKKERTKNKSKTAAI